MFINCVDVGNNFGPPCLKTLSASVIHMKFNISIWTDTFDIEHFSHWFPSWGWVILMGAHGIAGGLEQYI